MESRKVNTEASQLVITATNKGMSYQDIADLCGVSLGSVKRWVATGRAREVAIRPLVKKIGRPLLPAEKVAEILIEIYSKRGRRFRIKAVDLGRLAGRVQLKNSFFDALEDALDARNYLIVRGYDKEDYFFFVIRFGQFKKGISYTLQKKDFEKYFEAVAQEIDIADED